jgi:restriction endonuclease Mrr
MLTARGMRVIHQAAHRDGDGGVDLFAIDADGQTWVVQCKCWAAHRTVGPDVVRELAGAILAADRGKKTKSRGMIITTSKLTDGALKEADELNFAVINGPEFAAALAALPVR